jgi:hypothetical protein
MNALLVTTDTVNVGVVILAHITELGQVTSAGACWFNKRVNCCPAIDPVKLKVVLPVKLNSCSKPSDQLILDVVVRLYENVSIIPIAPLRLSTVISLVVLFATLTIARTSLAVFTLLDVIGGKLLMVVVAIYCVLFIKRTLTF